MEKMPRSAEYSHEIITELPEKSQDAMTNFYLRELKRNGSAETVLNYLNEASESEAKSYDSAEDFLAANPDYLEQVNASISSEEKAALREYSSWNFAWINSVERGFWDYEKLGKKTPEKEAQIHETSEKIDHAITAAPAPQEDFMTYRGTDLSGFSKYGVQSLEDLEQMKGQIMVESGYTSTAIARENSFVEQEGTFWIGKSNVEMRYHIPGNKKTSIALLSDELSHSPNQTEVLLNRGMMSYISDVSFDEPNHAVVDAIVIPFELYDPARLD